ncbi:MAG: hypothetical protein JSS79_15445 [Bacteroidetes bacterium]|nr:hypothetical protein [Bacteroidota bacterium]
MQRCTVHISSIHKLTHGYGKTQWLNTTLGVIGYAVSLCFPRPRWVFRILCRTPKGHRVKALRCRTLYNSVCARVAAAQGSGILYPARGDFIGMHHPDE